MTISSLKNTKLYYSYVITKGDYDIIHPTVGNRGGTNNKKIYEYLKIIRDGKYDPDLCLIYVDPFGNIIDGEHKYHALVICEMEIPIRMTPPKSLGQISNFNSGPNPKWRPEENFYASITDGSQVAILLDELRERICDINKIERSKLSSGEMYGILVGDTKYFSAGRNAPTIDMWKSDILLSLTKKREFKRNLNAYAKIKYALRSIHDAYKIGKAVMELHFNPYVDFDVTVFCDALEYEGFILDCYNVPAIKAKALLMYQKQMKRVA